MQGTTYQLNWCESGRSCWIAGGPTRGEQYQIVERTVVLNGHLRSDYQVFHETPASDDRLSPSLRIKSLKRAKAVAQQHCDQKQDAARRNNDT
jgi:hypothetical protein